VKSTKNEAVVFQTKTITSFFVDFGALNPNSARWEFAFAIILRFHRVQCQYSGERLFLRHRFA